MFKEGGGMLVDLIADVVETVLAESVKGVKGVVVKVPTITLDIVDMVLDSADIKPKDLYGLVVKGGKPFAQLGVKEQIIYNTAIIVIQQLAGAFRSYESEKADMQNEIDEAKKVAKPAKKAMKRIRSKSKLTDDGWEIIKQGE